MDVWRKAGCIGLVCALAQGASAKDASFKDFDSRAKHGDRLTVVFFGASLTWGANSSDQMTTSYRARMVEKFEAAYPKAHFHFFDGAIGGTGSQLGVFRLDRDVLTRKPDLVFLDFSANDDIYSKDPEQNASYESIVRRLVGEAGVPVVQVIFPFKWNVTKGTTEGMARRDSHLAISKAYGTPCGDAISLAIDRIKSGKTTADTLWEYDGVHPGDEGYRLFADAAWDAYQEGVTSKRVCKVPEKMVYADTYMTHARVPIASLFGRDKLPAGWSARNPDPTSACFDMQMSRWLDELVIGHNRKPIPAGQKTPAEPQEVAPLKVKFNGSMVLLFGESTMLSGIYRVTIDGKVMEHMENWKKTDVFDAGGLGKRMGNNAHHCPTVATQLDPAVEHVMEITPLLEADKDQTIMLESICVAGGKATVVPVTP